VQQEEEEEEGRLIIMAFVSATSFLGRRSGTRQDVVALFTVTPTMLFISFLLVDVLCRPCTTTTQGVERDFSLIHSFILVGTHFL
jgi:hypothetical protein